MRTGHWCAQAVTVSEDSLAPVALLHPTAFHFEPKQPAAATAAAAAEPLGEQQAEGRGVPFGGEVIEVRGVALSKGCWSTSWQAWCGTVTEEWGQVQAVSCSSRSICRCPRTMSRSSRQPLHPLPLLRALAPGQQ